MQRTTPSPFVALLLLAGCIATSGDVIERPTDESGQTEARAVVRINQLGYPARGRKLAVVESPAQDPLPWTLLDAEQEIVAEGRTTVFGDDVASGRHVHHVDFGAVQDTGSGYRLEVDGQTSDPFVIATDLHTGLARDAARFFYHQRSGVPIEQPFAGEPRLVRGAGHTSDTAVPCLPELACGEGFTLDVSGGWYDAGDHGKYVVNGGIAVWTLLDLHELHGPGKVLADGSLGIPESGNGIDDVLDEARFELEFLLRMQAPDDVPAWAGLAFHKIHDVAWTPLPTNPAEAASPRFLHRPSTAATLNLAAVAAQGARVWRKIDPAFAAEALAAAERAFAAAAAHPDLFAPQSDNTGGGPYDDDAVDDEFYWAAVELYLTTQKPEYLERARQSPSFAVVRGDRQTVMDWKQVDALGTISMAVVPGFDEATTQRARASIVAAADALLDVVAREGFPVPFSATAKKDYPWGSNSMVLNHGIVLALAHVFTGDARYLAAVSDGLDYLLGRNPLGQSYVTGYGTKPLEHPHHRFFADQLDPRLPSPPPGFLSGGPNSSLQDPYARQIGLPGCAPQRCFVDHIESWSTNEVAINWNAPLSWVAGFVAARGNETPTPTRRE